MDLRIVGWIVINLIAFAVPTFAALEKFGLQTAVDPASSSHVIAIVGGALFGFLASLLGSWLVRRRDISGPEEVVLLFREEVPRAS